MNCKEFENWLLSVEKTSNDTLPEDVFEHLSICADCKQVYYLDKNIENRIDTAFVQEKIPPGLEARIESRLNSVSGPPFVFTKKMAGLVAGIAAIIVIACLNIFNNTPFKFQNLQQLSEKAVLRHLKGDTTMTFDAAHIEQAIGMLRKELQFKVILPDLAAKGFILLGGRICSVDRCRTVYLFYKNKEKTCSLFIMNYDHLEFEMADGSRFNNELKGCKTDIWKEKGQVYAMVY